MTTPNANPMRWVPSLYFVQGLQFFVVMKIAQMLFKDAGIENEIITRWIGTLSLAWAFKPLWSPLIELVASKKRVVVVAQFVSAAGLAVLAMSLQTPTWFAIALCVLFVLAYTSATHDIACDGLYMASLNSSQQASYAGWQGAFFNTSRFLIQGGLLVLVGWLEHRQGKMTAWSSVFFLLAAIVAVLASWNARALPPATGTPPARAELWKNFWDVLIAFLKKPGIGLAFLFIVLFRFAEGQVQTISLLFFMEDRAKGGLGLTTDQVGAIYGTAGTAAFLVGSILGGYFTAALGLKRAMPILIVAMMAPNAVFFFLSSTVPTDLLNISVAVMIEMAGYGFGFVGMILFIMQVVAPGRFNTAHYAFGSGLMQLGNSFSSAISGDIQKALGYQDFFGWTIVAGLPVLGLWLWVRHMVPNGPTTQAVAA